MFKPGAHDKPLFVDPGLWVPEIPDRPWRHELHLLGWNVQLVDRDVALKRRMNGNALDMGVRPAGGKTRAFLA